MNCNANQRFEKFSHTIVHHHSCWHRSWSPTAYSTQYRGQLALISLMPAILLPYYYRWHMIDVHRVLILHPLLMMLRHLLLTVLHLNCRKICRFGGLRKWFTMEKNSLNDEMSNTKVPVRRFGWKKRERAAFRCFLFSGFDVADCPRAHFAPFVWRFNFERNLLIFS